jgi:hypothetical protein
MSFPLLAAQRHCLITLSGTAYVTRVIPYFEVTVYLSDAQITGFRRCVNEIFVLWNVPHRTDSAGRAKAWVCTRSIDGNAGSNAAGSMDVWLLCVLYTYRSLRRADHSSRGVLPCVV